MGILELPVVNNRLNDSVVTRRLGYVPTASGPDLPPLGLNAKKCHRSGAKLLFCHVYFVRKAKCSHDQ